MLRLVAVKHQLKQVSAFLGITDYYRRFIPNFEILAALLADLTKWKDCSTSANNFTITEYFHVLKRAVCAQPILYFPDFFRDFAFQKYGSNIGLGAALSPV